MAEEMHQQHQDDILIQEQEKEEEEWFPDDDDEGDDSDSEVFKNVKNWRDVPVDIWYKIKKVHDIYTKNGPAVILEMKSLKNGEVKTWVTKMIADKIKEFPMSKINNGDGKEEEESLYIKPKGKKQSKAGRQYFDFKVRLFKKQKEDKTVAVATTIAAHN